MMRLFLFLLFPALELYLLFKVGAEIGALKMVLWIFGSAFFGVWVARTHSQYSMLKVRADMAAGRMPQNTIIDGVLMFMAGVLLILPGLITDALGLLLLLPPVRQAAAGGLGRYAEKNSAGAPGRGTTIFFTRSFGAGPGTGFSQQEQEPGPRQATVIDSTAIEINVGEDSKNGQAGNAVDAADTKG